MSNITGTEGLQRLLSALAEQLQARGARTELVVIGGAGLLALGVVERATRDIDVVALLEDGGLRSAEPFPAELAAARERVSRDFGVPEIWLNGGPTSLLAFGLPDGFLDRVETWHFGSALTVHFASRLDQIHLKLYALADAGPGRHESDLVALRPTPNELLQAARWVRTHDPSPAFRQLLEGALRHLGVEDADLGA